MSESALPTVLTDDPTLGWQAFTSSPVHTIEVPGDHTGMVKPGSPADDIYRHIKLRLMADRPTGQQISANAAAEAEVMSRVAAARELDDRQTLCDIAAGLLKKEGKM